MSNKSPSLRGIHQPDEDISSTKHTKILEGGAKKPDSEEARTDNKWTEHTVEMRFNDTNSDRRFQKPMPGKDELIISEFDMTMEQMGKVIYDIGIPSSTPRNRMNQSNLTVFEKLQLINEQLYECRRTLKRIQKFFEQQQKQVSEYKLYLMQCSRSMNQLNSKVEPWLAVVKNRSKELDKECTRLSDYMDEMTVEAQGLAALAGTSLAIGPTAFYAATGTAAASFGTAILVVGGFALAFNFKQQKEHQDTKERLTITKHLVEKYNTIINNCSQTLEKSKTICTFLDKVSIYYMIMDLISVCNFCWPLLSLYTAWQTASYQSSM